MGMPKELWNSLKEWSIRVAQRWWAMLSVPLTFVPLLVGIILFLRWARNTIPPLSWWIIGLVVGGAILFFAVSFWAFHTVKMERDYAKEERDKAISAQRAYMAKEITNVKAELPLMSPDTLQVVKSIPTLITDIDKRRAQLIQAELDKRRASGDMQFVFSMLSDAWCITLGTEPPTLPTEIGNGDLGTIINTMVKYASGYKDGYEQLKARAEELGDLETGLLLARVVNKHLGIDDELAKESMNETLKSARGLLPGSIAVETTKAIDNYLDYSRAYRATDCVIIPLSEVIEENDILRSIPQMKQLINIFQRFKEQYLEKMNINQAKVNEALKLL